MWWISALAWATPYTEQVDDIGAVRWRLAAEWALDPDAVRTPAHEAFADAISELIPSWIGTPWAMDGTATEPHTGAIACGYFVSTVLRDAGLPVERVSLAQQGAEDIIRTLTDEHEIRRYRNTPVSAILAEHDRSGVYVVGLDWHVGLLVVARGESTFCHASRSATRQVVCEPAASARSLRSKYTVVGPLSSRVIAHWLSQEPLETVSD